MMKVRTGIGQDSHCFLSEYDAKKPCVLGGLVFEDVPGFRANSDGDVIFHAICNAISSVTGEIILGKLADELLKREGIIDSSIYLQEALKTLGRQTITHVALTVEAARPKLLNRIFELRQNIAREMNMNISQIGITATTGERLTDFGCGKGLQCFCIITTIEE